VEQYDYQQQAVKFHDVFGFDAALLRDDVIPRATGAARSYLGGLYPPAAPGMARWMHTVAYLREALLPLGWDSDDTDLLSGVVHHERRLRIITAAGNSATGVPRSAAGKDPSTKWPKGEKTAAVVAGNVQLSLFEQAAQRPDARPYDTWFLLQHATVEEVRAELSRPGAIDARGYITSWTDRYLLGSISNDLGVADVPFDGDIDDDGIDISVEPK
jgi:hypothetical protein